MCNSRISCESYVLYRPVFSSVCINRKKTKCLNDYFTSNVELLKTCLLLHLG